MKVLKLLLMSVTLASVFSFEATTQGFNFSESDFKIVWQNSRVDTLYKLHQLDSITYPEYIGYKYLGNSTYRLTLEHDVSLDAGCSYFLFFSNYMNKLLLKNKK